MATAKKKIKKAKPKSKKKIVKKLKKKTVTKIAKRSKKPVKKPRGARKPTASTAKPKTKKTKPKRKKKAGPPPEPVWHLPKEGEVEVGAVEDYLSHLGVILTTLKTPLVVGETVTIRGFTTNLDQIVRSIQIEHNSVNQAEIGQAVGFKIDEKVRKHDRIFKKAVTA